MLDSVRAGLLRAVLAWKPDRLHRRASELEPFIDLAGAHDLQIQTVTTGNVDLTTPHGRMVARMLGAAVQREAETTRKRIRAQKDQAASSGAYRGGPARTATTSTGWWSAISRPRPCARRPPP